MNAREGSGTNSRVGLLQGRVCLITGANSGIGKATALGLARLGATVVLASRDTERGGIARRDIIEKTENPEVSVGQVDLASLESVRSFAKSFNEKFPHLHVLVNNAGIYESRRIVTVDGFESTFAINHLAHFLLTNLLLESLKASAPSRIVNVTSEAQRAGHVNFDDLQGERKYSGMKSYPQSKLANVLFTYELARRLKGTEVTANCVHPGTVVWLASSPEVEHVTGKYFQKQAERKSTKESYDLNVARRLWDVSSELTGLTQT
jgi:NAD(P)-dependent dehydrogenase (short-subunit alcohol dehydrogenase family)